MMFATLRVLLYAGLTFLCGVALTLLMFLREIIGTPCTIPLMLVWVYLTIRSMDRLVWWWLSRRYIRSKLPMIEARFQALVDEHNRKYGETK